MRRSLLTALVAGVIAVSSAHAAVPVRVELVAVDETPGRIVATVGAYGTDGRPITALTTSDFRATLNNVPLAVRDVQSANSHVPASLVLLVDTSGSMAGNPITQAKQAMLDFIAGLDPTDRVAVISFNSSVSLLQDFTTDHGLLNNAVGSLAAKGDTALYDAVIQASTLAAGSGPTRKMIVLLSDGSATTSLEKRTAAIDAARTSNASVVALGFGTDIDRPFLNELTGASGGRLVEASNTTALKAAYVDLAAAIRNQYTLTLDVPSTFDRTLPARLILQFIFRGNIAYADRQLDVLAGALPPPFTMTVSGIKVGDKLTDIASIVPAAAPGVNVAKVDYSVDGTSVFTAVEPPFTYSLNPASFPPGPHTLKVVASEASGRIGEAQSAFVVPAPAAAPKSFSIPTTLIAVVALLIAGALAAKFVLKRANSSSDTMVHRVMPFAARNVEEAPTPVEGWPAPLPAAPPPPQVALGRIVVMNEEAIRAGSLDAIREFEIGDSPLTLGTGAACDVSIEDSEGRIAAEEARLWVQKGRLVYHKLTTLSAMATEGVTSGWQLLEDGEEFQVGPYRIVYQSEIIVVQEPEPETTAEPDWNAPASYGELWARSSEDPRISA